MRQPWDSSGRMDPFRDDPLPLPRGSEDPVTAPEPSLADRPDVCTCGRCHFSHPVQDQRKCCHSIPRWQDEYEAGSHLIALCAGVLEHKLSKCSGDSCLLDLPNFKN